MAVTLPDPLDRPTRDDTDRDAAQDERDELARVITERWLYSAMVINVGAEFWPRDAANAAADAVIDAGWHR